MPDSMYEDSPLVESMLADEAIHQTRQPVKTFLQEAIDQTRRELEDAIVALLDRQETLPGIIAMAKDVANGETRYISLIASTCKVCGFVEEAHLEGDATADEMSQLMSILQAACPDCEEAIAAQLGKSELLEDE